MKDLFDLKNPVWKFMGKLVDMMLLSGVWLLCSLPIVTIGASTVALYYATIKLSEDQETYVLKDFIGAFRANLKQGIVAGLVAELIIVILVVDFSLICQIDNSLGILMFWMMFVITAVFLMTVVHFFPLMAHCDTNLKNLLIMAFVIACKNPGWTFFMIISVVVFVAVGLFWMMPILFIAIGGSAYLHSKILNVLWKEYGL